MTGPQLGDVALAKYPGDEPKLYMRQREFSTGKERWVSTTGTTSNRFEAAEWHRPLAVIDPADRAQVERLHRLRREVGGQRVERTQNALREFAKPTASKPDEPTGLGAVVEDADGMKWILVYDHSMWQQHHDRSIWRLYDQINVVRVLSGGVTS